jgi:putative ABC transport system permease protein
MAELFDKIGWVNKILGLVAYLVVAVAAGSILASIYNTMNERRREFAIPARSGRAAPDRVSRRSSWSRRPSRRSGSLLGFVVYGAVVLAARSSSEAQTGVRPRSPEVQPAIVAAPRGMIVLGRDRRGSSPLRSRQRRPTSAANLVATRETGAALPPARGC